jgi:hypothetical protein
MEFVIVLAAVLAQDTQELIRRLGHDEYQVREKAEAELRKIGKPALTELQCAEKDPDPEIRTRAASLVRYLTQIRWFTDETAALREAAARKKKLLVFSTGGELDGYA